jgi:putative flippase GtrA
MGVSPDGVTMTSAARPTRFSALWALAMQLLKFASAGAVGSIGHYAVLIGGVELLKLPAVVATSMGYLVGGVINYILARKFVFRADVPHRVAVVKFVVVAATGMVINAIVLGLLLRTTQLHYLVAQVGTTCLILLWNFAMNRAWTFAVKR